MSLMNRNKIETDQQLLEMILTGFLNIHQEVDKKILALICSFSHQLHLRKYRKIINSLNLNKSLDIYDILVKIIKMGKSVFEKTLCHNSCLEKETFPYRLKYVFISPIC